MAELTRGEKFVEYCQFWIRVLGLADWEIHATVGELPSNTGVQAQCQANWEQHLAVLTYNTLYRCPLDTMPEMDVDDLALHEVLHVFFYDMIETARACKPGNPTMDMVEHAAIVRLIKAFREEKEILG